MSSLLRSPGESVVVQMLVEVQIGDDISVCCTWDRRCGSLTILKDTSYERHVSMDTRPARLGCRTLLNTPRMFGREGSASSLLPSKRPHYNRISLSFFVVCVWTCSSRTRGWAWGWRGRCPGWWCRRWGAGGRAPPMSCCSKGGRPFQHQAGKIQESLSG